MPVVSSASTLRHAITIEGHGLHGNRPCKVTLKPVSRPTGLFFLHRPSGVSIPARADYVGDLRLATTLERDGIKIGTVEHLLSALAGLEIDHLCIEVDDVELPILDGSASQWAHAIREAGIQAMQGVHKRFIQVTRPIELADGNRWMRVSPYPCLRIRYTVDFPHPAIGRQSREMSITGTSYEGDIAPARTFCMEEDIEKMRAVGLSLGGSLDNAVVFGQEGPLNEALRFEDEVVRHKMLDLLGDMALLGAPLLGLVEAKAAGHAFHVAMVKALLAQENAWRWVETPDKPSLHRSPALSASASL